MARESRGPAPIENSRAPPDPRRPVMSVPRPPRCRPDPLLLHEGGAAGGRCRRACCATPLGHRSRSPRPASTRRPRSPTCIRAPWWPHRRGAAGLTVRFPRAAELQDSGRIPRAAMPRISADFRTFTFRLARASTSPTIRPSGQARELVAPGLCLQPQAPLRPALEQPQPVPAGGGAGSSACRSCDSRC